MKFFEYNENLRKCTDDDLVYSSGLGREETSSITHFSSNFISNARMSFIRIEVGPNVTSKTPNNKPQNANPLKH